MKTWTEKSWTEKSRDAWKQLAMVYVDHVQSLQETVDILQGVDRDLLTERAETAERERDHWEGRAIRAEQVLQSEQWQFGKDYPRLDADYKRLYAQHESLLVKCELLYRIIRWLSEDRNKGRITYIPDGLQDLYEEVIGPPRA